jgi:hypothetical protein
MLRRLAACALLVATAIAVASGCTDETIVLASLPTTDAGAPAPAPIRCVTIADCPTTDYYCSMTSCDAQTGTCVLAPVVCDPSEAPVCGCDNITYFNDCLREANGIAASTPNPCMNNPQLCGGPSNTQCPDGALCARLGLIHGPCTDAIPGTCWFLPAKCPTTPPPDLWDSCDSAGALCVDTCNAITQGGAYRRSLKCGE